MIRQSTTHTGSDQIDHDQIYWDLTARQRQVLRIVIEEYITHVKPVGSRKIVQDYQLGVSAATIRNDMAKLEHYGLITKVHTSSGRMPSLLGYRLYVRHMAGTQQLPATWRQSLQERFDALLLRSQDWLEDATRLLSSVSRSLALATELAYVSQRFRHIELIAIHASQILMVLVLDEGQVRQRVLDNPQGFTQEELKQISGELNIQLAGLEQPAIQEKMPTLSVRAQTYGELLTTIIPVPRAQSRLPLVRQGLDRMLEAPEFAERHQLQRVVATFDSWRHLDDIPVYTQQPGDVHVLIAGDGKEEWADFADMSLVLSSYGIPNRATGIVGVVGPVRMAYGYNMGAVRSMAALMSAFVRNSLVHTSPDILQATKESMQ